MVGDEKQSIMSVQGADVACYRGFRQLFAARAAAGREPWREEPLGRSFRSARPILDLVDAVFADPAARAGVVSGADWPAHECFLTAAQGEVEVWPLIEAEPASRAEGWQLPDRHEVVPRSESRLARAIARQIYEWRRDQVLLSSTGQPIRAGDVMVLLPRRGILQDLLIRELKRLQIPVAGADRLALTDEIAVMDLIALGDALLLPEDDLTLAAVLKSPLFGLDEEELFALAHGRGEATLYERLRELRHARPRFAAAYERFAELLRQADFAPPYEFYARLLGAGGGRERLLARLGPAAAEPIEAFLAQALAFERAHPPSLQAFLHWLRADSTELIRDPDRPRDEVRVLTCHGAKGLEAPIVFIADAGFAPTTRDRLLWTEPGGLPLWRVRSELRDGQSEAADQRGLRAQQQEHRRLLYVALTRARERLIVCGWERKGSGGEPCWYDLITAGMERLGALRAPARLAPELAGETLRYGNLAPTGPAQLRLALAGRGRRAPCPAAALAAPAGAGRGADPGPAQPVPGARGGPDQRGLAAARDGRRSLPPRPPDPSPAAEPAGASRPRSAAPRSPVTWPSPRSACPPPSRRRSRPRSWPCSPYRSWRPCSGPNRMPRCRSRAWSAGRRSSARSTGSR